MRAIDLAGWAFAFAFTQAIEVPIYMRALRVGPLKAFGASAITHPVVWFVIPGVWSALHGWAALHIAGFSLGWIGQRLGYGVLAESFAVAVEAAYFSSLGLKRAFLGSLAANAASALLGLLWSALIGWP